MAAPKTLHEALSSMNVPASLAGVAGAMLDKLYDRCMCAGCPTYTQCEAARGEALLYCVPLRGKSDAITLEDACVCRGCPVYEQVGLATGGWYCTRGPERTVEEFVARIKASMG